MVWFVGAGSGAADLITVRGMRLLEKADVIIYTGSLINPELLDYAKEGARCLNSAHMTLEQVISEIEAGQEQGLDIVRLHTGDPCLYGAIREQMDELAARSIAFEQCPGVSSFCGAAAAVKAEYTLPGVSQSVIITRMAGKTPVPDRESIARLAEHQTSMVVFLSAGMLDALQEELIRGGYAPDTPAAIVYKATWPDEKVYRTSLGELAKTGAEMGVSRTALVLVGRFLGDNYERSLLYDPSFETGYRKASH